MKNLRALIIMTIATVGLAGCSYASKNPAHKAPGKYETSSKTTTSSGTTVRSDQTTHVEVDQYGNRKATVETETSRDPEGLMNKSTSSSTTTYRAQ